ncbi:MAG: winged helix-turn-helix domain-containing protein, partial [Gammaproteobacteria bacterium]
MQQDMTFTFGSIVLKTNTQILHCKNESIVLPPKVYHLLLYFLQHPGRLISREELHEAVWRDTIVEDTSLRLAVNALRRALHDNCKAPRFILTACKRGYRFLPDVTVEYGSPESVGAAPADGAKIRRSPGNPDRAESFEPELEKMVDAFELANSCMRHMIFLSGERRTGKTVLIDHFLRRIRHPESAMLHARCVQMNGTPEPFLPLLEALEDRCLEPGGDKA